MKNFITLLFTILLVQISFGQRTCGTSELVLQKMETDPNYQNYRDQLDQYTAEWSAANDVSKTNEVITISVVVHVLHTGGVDNISDAQIHSQLVVLNDDFRKLNANFSNTPMAFQALTADTEIEFCLAALDPDGNVTDGITRTQVSASFDAENDYYDAQNGKAPWDNTKYLNIWVTDLDALSLLGFATPPGVANGDDDGAVIDPKSFGTVGTAAGNAPNHLGRTATHEIGHYLNFEHLWGIQDGGCSEDDGVADTPNQDVESDGCPSFPFTDACTTSGDGIMYMNYLDYSHDDCMTMFSLGQKARMLAALNGPRSGLKASVGCSETTSINSSLNSEINVTIFPNPATKFVNMEFANTQQDLKVDLINSMGQIVVSKTKQSNNAENIQFNVSNLKVGIYFVRVTTENENFLTLKKFLVKH